MPRGAEYLIPLADLLDAAEKHERGWSLRSIARLHWKRWGYASDKSALEGLRRALRVIDAPVRDRLAATRLASTMHGNSARAAHQPGHPDHARFLAHRAMVRRNKQAGS
jgi:hypothetical protein